MEQPLMDSKLLGCTGCMHKTKTLDEALGSPWCQGCKGYSRFSRLDESESKHATESPLKSQVGGGHYKNLAIQPIEFCVKNKLNPCQTHAIKYLTRTKGDVAKVIEDRQKAKHMIDLEIEYLREGLLKV